jgi:pilus assembly protein CpaE
MLATIVISPSEEFRQRIHELLEGSEQIEIRAELNNYFFSLDNWILDQIKAVEPDLVIVDLAFDKDQGILTVEKLVEICKSTQVIVAGDGSDADMILRSMRAGAKEFLPLPVESEALFSAVERVSKIHTVPGREKRQLGKIFTFFSAKGGTGSTVISTNFAVNIAEMTKSPTILVDLDLQLGEVSLFLGIKSGFNIVDVAGNIHRMDPILLRGFITKHPSGLDVMTAPDSLDKVESVGPSQVSQILQYLRTLYDYVIVDTSNSFDDYTVAALDQATTLFLISNTDLASLRNAQRCLSIFERMGYKRDRIRLLINRYTKSVAIRSKDIEDTLNFPVYWWFPSDWPTIVTALNSGVPIRTSDHTDIGDSFVQFVQQVVGIETPKLAPKKKGFLSILGR